MKPSLNKYTRRLALCGAYALGVFFILASGGGGGSSGGGTDPDTSCRLEVSAIAAATGSNDIWIGVYSIRSGEEMNSVARLDSTGAERIRIPVGTGPGNLIRTIAMSTDASNDVYVGGDFNEGIFRLNSNGTADTGFDVGTGFNGSVRKITPLNDGSGSIYVAGYFTEYDGVAVSGLVLLDNTGTLDTVNFVTVTRDVDDIALAGGAFFPPGYVYSGGSSIVGANRRLERWTDMGANDPGPPSFDPAIGPILSVVPALDALDKVYAGGEFTNGIVRLFNNGNTDTAFLVGTGFNAAVRRILRTDDGTEDIYAVGEFTTYNGVSANGIERLNPDGSREAGFTKGTGFTIPGGSEPFEDIAGIALALNPAGTVYVGGDFLLYNDVPQNGLSRLNPDGSLDTGFAVDVTSSDDNCTNDTIPES